MSRWLVKTLLLWTSVLSVSSGQAGTILNFPRLYFAARTFTGVAIANPTDEAALVLLTAYGSQGQLLQGDRITNPVEVTIGANQQFVRTTYEIFGSGLAPETVAWFQANSEVDGLTGFFLFLNGKVTFFDGADLPVSAKEIIFHEIRLGGEYSTELNLVNPGSPKAVIDVRLFGGTTTVSRQLILQGKGVARFDAAAFFGIPPGDDPGKLYVRVSSSVPIAGFEFVRGKGDLLGLNARPAAEQLNRLFFPQLVVLGPYKSELVVVNYVQETVILTITAHRPDGTLYGDPNLQSNPVTRALAPGGIMREDAADLFGFSGEDLLEGWIEVESTSEAINGSLTYVLPELNSLASVAGEPLGRTEALFSHIATTLGYYTGVAILNGGSLAANIRVVALREDGTLLGTYTGMLRPGERMSKLITDLVPAAANRSSGMIWATSDVPVYMTGLFVNIRNGVLTNIPPQPVPATFRPDQGQPRLRLSPTLAVLAPNQIQAFQSEGTGGTVRWSVNGVQGGTSVTGTISSTGQYNSPASVPAGLPVTIAAETDGQVAAASVDVLNKQVLVGGLGLVQSVAYLGGLQRVYAAELSMAGGLGQKQGFPILQNVSTRILDVTGTASQLVLQYPGEDVSKLIAYKATDGKEYLLLAGRSSGRIMRLNPLNGQSSDVVTGLNAPAAMVVDPVTGDLLVAEKDGVVAIPAVQLNPGVGPATVHLPTLPGSRQAVVFEGEDLRGIAVNQCSGDIYVADAGSGSIKQYRRSTGEVMQTVGGLGFPGQMLATYRSGFTCPQSFHLLAIDEAADEILLVDVVQGTSVRWAGARGGKDIAFLPSGGGLSGSEAVLVAEESGGLGSIGLVGVPGLYVNNGINTPKVDGCLGTVTLQDPNLAAAVRDALGLGPEDPVTCEAARTLTFLYADSRGISSLEGIQSFANLRRLHLRYNSLTNISQVSELPDLFQLLLYANSVSDISPIGELRSLRILGLGANPVSDFGPLSGLWALETLGLYGTSASNLDFLASPQLANLYVVYLDGNQITDITPLAGLRNLGILRLDRNQITDISPLNQLTTLVELGLDGNRISNLSALSNLSNLRTLDLDNNLFSDITPLSGLTQIKELFLSDSLVADVSPLVANPGLGQGDTIDLERTSLDIDDCPNINILLGRGAQVLHSVSCP